MPTLAYKKLDCSCCLSLDELRSYYEGNFHHPSEDGLAIAESELTIDREGFFWPYDNKWGDDTKLALSYCVSTGFGAHQGKVAEAARRAARATGGAMRWRRTTPLTPTTARIEARPRRRQTCRAQRLRERKKRSPWWCS